MPGTKIYISCLSCVTVYYVALQALIENGLYRSIKHLYCEDAKAFSNINLVKCLNNVIVLQNKKNTVNIQVTCTVYTFKKILFI